MRKYILILLIVLILSGCQANTVTDPDTSDTTVQTEETGSETETTETQTEETAAEAGTEDTDTTLPETEEDDSESETTTSDTSEETEAEAELPPGVICYSQQLYVDADPPYRYLEDESNLPDFLTEEQNILYRQAQTAFAFLHGNPISINDFCPDGTNLDYNMRNALLWDNGNYYFPVAGKYAKWDDFHRMMLNVFTEEYYQSMSDDTIIDIDGNAYVIAAGGCSMPGCGVVPDTFTLLSQTDKEIHFTVTCGYKLGNDPDVEIEYRSLELVMENTANGWRFSRFDSGVFDSTETWRTRIRSMMPVIQWFAYGIDKIGFDEDDRITTENGVHYFRINDPTFTEAGIHSIATLREYLLQYFSTAYTDAILEHYSFLFLESNDALYIEGASGAASIYYTIDYYATDCVSDTEYTLILHTSMHTLYNPPKPIVMEFTFIRERDLWVCDASPSFRNCVLIHW